MKKLMNGENEWSDSIDASKVGGEEKEELRSKGCCVQ